MITISKVAIRKVKLPYAAFNEVAPTKLGIILGLNNLYRFDNLQAMVSAAYIFKVGSSRTRLAGKAAFSFSESMSSPC